jgi:hypothetical protein
VQWTTDGVPVSTATGSQSVPVAVPSLAGSFIVSWRDSRSGTVNGEIFAARLQSTGVLPIRSLELSAFAKTNSIVLRWNTLDEVNTSTFIVEKSSDGINFRSIGLVKAKGNGNGNYDLTDTRPLAGLNYYRIQLIDVNGSKMYSAIVAVQFTNVTKPSLLFYPNPVMSTSVLQVSNFQKGNYQVLVRDYMGRVQLQRGITITQSYEVFPLSLLTLSAGNYIIQLQGEQGTAITTVFQKR